MLDDEIIHSLFTSTAIKETNECHQAVSEEERFMNVVSLLVAHETTVQYYNMIVITKQAQVKMSKENKVLKKLKNKFNKKQRKRNWNV